MTFSFHKRLVSVFYSIPGSFIRVPILFVGFFLVSGDFKWVAAWVFILTSIVGTLIIMFLLRKRDPALFTERSNPSKTTQDPRDRSFFLLCRLMIGIWISLIPLDRRFGWSTEMPFCLMLLGEVMIIVGLIIVHYVFVANSFTSPLVKIQRDRFHRVITTGPYAFVRHPMYSGLSLIVLGSSFLLGSWPAAVVSVQSILLFYYRGKLEEEVLSQEFSSNYDNYKTLVKYRIVPFFL